MGMQDFAGRASDLDQRIAQAQPVTQQSPLEDTASLVPDSGTANVGQASGTGGQDVQTAPPAPQEDPEKLALYQRLQSQEAEMGQIRQALSLQAQQAAKLEEQNFLHSLQDELPEVRAQKLLEYRERQYQSIIGNLQGQLQTQTRASENEKQERAKGMVANILAQQFGVPQEDYGLLLMARDGNEMEKVAARLGARAQSTQQQAVMTQQDVAFLPTGDTGRSIPIEGPKKRSGDIDGLIGARDYEQRAIR